MLASSFFFCLLKPTNSLVNNRRFVVVQARAESFGSEHLTNEGAWASMRKDPRAKTAKLASGEFGGDFLCAGLQDVRRRALLANRDQAKVGKILVDPNCPFEVVSVRHDLEVGFGADATDNGEIFSAGFEMVQNFLIAPSGSLVGRGFVFKNVERDIAPPACRSFLCGFVGATTHIGDRTNRNAENLGCVG